MLEITVRCEWLCIMHLGRRRPRTNRTTLSLRHVDAHLDERRLQHQHGVTTQHRQDVLLRQAARVVEELDALPGLRGQEHAARRPVDLPQLVGRELTLGLVDLAERDDTHTFRRPHVVGELDAADDEPLQQVHPGGERETLPRRKHDIRVQLNPFLMQSPLLSPANLGKGSNEADNDGQNNTQKNSFCKEFLCV